VVLLLLRFPSIVTLVVIGPVVQAQPLCWMDTQKDPVFVGGFAPTAFQKINFWFFEFFTPAITFDIILIDIRLRVGRHKRDEATKKSWQRSCIF
jgi:NADH:ubiquinone oxidoreductase subunit H